MVGSRFLIAGGTGFIGRRLLDRLSKSDNEVYCLAHASRRQIDRLPPGVGVVEADHLAPDDATTLIAELNPSIVVNLAAAGVDPTSRATDRLQDGNADLVVRLLRMLEKASPDRVVHIGSWSEYAPNPDGRPLRETDTLLPWSRYGAAKAAATLVGNALARSMEMPFVTLRLFNVFGIGEKPTRLIPYLIERLSAGQPADMTSGEQVRDFMYVDDAVDAILTAARTNLENFSVYNVCTGFGQTVRSVAEETAAQIGCGTGLLNFGAVDSRADEPTVVIGDNTRFLQATGWTHTTPVPEGIARMIDEARGSGSRWSTTRN